MSEEMNSMEAWLAAEDSMKEIHERDLVKATVVAVNDNEAIVNIQGNKNDVPIAKSELAEPAPESAKDIVKVDDVIEVLVCLHTKKKEADIREENSNNKKNSM